MEVIIVATKTCHHCSIIEKELKSMNIPYQIRFIEEHPDLVKKHNIQKSPVIMVDGEIIFYGMPDIRDLKNYFQG